MQFVTTRDELRTIYKQPGDGAVRKELKALDGHSVSFIARSLLCSSARRMPGATPT